jgi:alpha-methylacyl-CoA racemase
MAAMAPLSDIRVIEMAGIGPGPFAGMLLSDMGADVIRIDRPADAGGDAEPVLGRGKRSVILDLKDPTGLGSLLRLVETADVLIDVYRPGVAERLGFGPAICLARNPRLVFGRMTGWGQSGPLAARAGHDIDYIAVAGALGAMGRAGAVPAPPLNLVADYGGGALYLVVGVLAALVERARTGKGQVVDAAMVDGAASLTALFHQMAAAGMWRDERGVNLLDGGAPFYDVYPASDGRFVALGAIEPKFFAELLSGLGLDADDLPAQYDRSGWPRLREAIGAALARETRDFWEERFAGSDACVAPVLTMAEAATHPYNTARGVFVETGGVIQPGPAPRFEGAKRAPGPAPRPGDHTVEILASLGGGSKSEDRASLPDARPGREPAGERGTESRPPT